MKLQILVLIKMMRAVIIMLSFSSMALIADPVSDFLNEGKATPPWKLSIGNALAWGIPIENQAGKTKRGNLTVEPISIEKENDAIKVKWRGRNKQAAWFSNITLNSHKIDLSSVENVAALEIQLRIIELPSSIAKIAMRCNWSNKCESELALNPIFNQMPKNEWTALTLPLNCFNKDGNFDFKNLTDIFSISTQGKMELDLAKAYLVALPEGSKGCK
ncbi:putative glycoside hydrolase [Catenovulum sp. 2E275]|uniref:putative glycoside hydrolase n=1 Tax=Catenovulum sp. 2E275 TaxID=2980497 RepID=UPI0021D0551E|nr:putative glycoside hydrolase [Catenovulum sp. 2E275]MCU4675595.1 putative glycoside hydrolase [Catenovulum sp. 2E275]